MYINKKEIIYKKKKKIKIKIKISRKKIKNMQAKFIPGQLGPHIMIYINKSWWNIWLLLEEHIITKLQIKVTHQDFFDVRGAFHCYICHLLIPILPRNYLF